ncbi:beta-1,4-galactosyltransferase galt-1-like [Tubulanus polymorphus]|uniref:beta-1,4-galactosyltransferase galt-1-like n=1 Tax=Tubulanus polymorphus TaxID=672921 RepID=UPI003DA6B234
MKNLRLNVKNIVLLVIGLNIFAAVVFYLAGYGSPASSTSWGSNQHLPHLPKRTGIHVETDLESRDLDLKFQGEIPGEAVVRKHGEDAGQRGGGKAPANQKPFMHKELAKSKQCPQLIEPGPLPEQQRFQPFRAHNRDAFLFSAFYDDRGSRQKFVRVVGISSKSQISGFCQLWFENRADPLVISPLSVQPLPEGHGRLYNSFYFNCPVSGVDGAPYIVSVVPDRCDMPANRINVLNRAPVDYAKLTGFAVCMPPFNFGYKRVDQIVENVELNSLLGADHFTFYNHTLGEPVARVLRDYESRGTVELVRWHPPVVVDKWPERVEVEVHYFAQIACLNDCLFRNMKKYKYVVVTDLDEFAVPRRHRTWRGLIDGIRAKNNGAEPASVMFLNTFFKTEWPDDEETGANATLKKLNLESLLKTRREPRVHGAGQRSKNIVVASRALVLGVHNVWEYSGAGSRDSYVCARDEGLLHHYRNWESKGDTNYVKDRHMLTFADDLVKRVVDAKKRLKLWN